MPAWIMLALKIMVYEPPISSRGICHECLSPHVEFIRPDGSTSVMFTSAIGFVPVFMIVMLNVTFSPTSSWW